MRYVIYARKSTEDEDRQVLSIEAQLVELQEYAAKEKLEIVASFQEAKTAKEPGRIKFAELKGNLGKKISLSNVQHILQNPFYVGLMRYKGEFFEGTHEPLISKKLFDVCQEVMQKRGKVRPDKKHNFPFLGLMKCASCGCSITAQYAKGNGGIYTYYRCTKKRGACEQRYSENVLAAQIKTFLQKVSLSSQDTEKVLAALDSEQDKTREVAQNQVGTLKAGLSQIEAKLQKLLDVYLEDALTQKEYAAKKDVLMSQKVSLQEKISEIEQGKTSWLEPAREFVKSLNQAANLIESENLSEMTTFLKNIGANHILRNRQFVFEPKIEYKMTAERGQSPREALTFPTWCARKESNLQPFA